MKIQTLGLLSGAALLLAGCNGAEPTPRRIVQQGDQVPAEIPSVPTVDGNFPSTGQSAVALLHDRLMARERSVEQTTVDTLSRIGEPAVPALSDALRDPEPEIRRDAARALARMGGSAAKAVPDLIAALDDSDDDVRKIAIRALGEIGAPAGAAVPALMEKLRSATKEEAAPAKAPNGKSSADKPATLRGGR